MKTQHVQNLSVVSLNAGEKLGSVSSILLDADGRSVTSLGVEASGGAGTRWIAAARIHAVGPDALTVEDASCLVESPPAQETLDLSSLLNRKVVSEGGTLLGQIASVELNDTDLTVTHLEVSPGFFKSNTMIPMNHVVNIGHELVIVSDEVSAGDDPSAASSTESETPMVVGDIEPREATAPRQ